MPDVTNLSSTVEGVVKELGESTPVSTPELVAAVLRRHAEYGHKRAADIPVAWPTEPRRATPRDWLEEVAAVYGDTLDRLHGRALILGLALVDLAAGRSMVEAGLFYAIAGELDPPLPEALSEGGHERLRRIPLAALAAGALQPDEFAHGAALHALALSRQGRRLAASVENQVIILYLASGAEQVRILAPDPIHAVAFSGDGSRIVTVDSQGRVALWPVTGGHTPSSVYETHMEDINLAVISANGARAAMTGGKVGGHMHIVDTLSGAIYRDDAVDRYEDASLGSIGVSPDGNYLLGYAVFGAVYDYPARELSGGARLTDISDLHGGTTIAVGPAGLLAATDDNSRLTLWRRGLSEGQLGYTLQSEIELPGTSGALELGDLAVSPDGTMVAAAGPDGVTLWSVASGAAAALLPLSGEPAISSQVSQADRRLAGLAFSGDGRRLALSRDDGVVEIWDVGLEPPQAPAPVAGFIADRPDGADYLDIDNDVDAFASLIAARSVEPPLSIGLFGEWGSGKTFFTRRLRDRVAEITAWARDSGALQKDLAIYKRVAQIEFNAWHYSAGDLWAGLVEHLFTNLELYPNEPTDPVQARVETLLEELGLVRARLEVSDTQASAAQQRLEAEFMESLALLLTRSPRALKRFVNVYRLVKVRRQYPYDFVRERGPATPYKVVMLLLAVVAGLPDVAARFFELLRSDADRPASLEDLVTRLERETGHGDSAEPELRTGPDVVEEKPAFSADHVARLRAWLEDPQAAEREAWKTLATSALAEWAEIVARYSFRVQV